MNQPTTAKPATLAKADVMKRLRSIWGDMLAEDDAQLDVDIELLTPDGQSGQPLLYDVKNRYNGELFTYTWVELPEQTERQLGLAGVTAEQAREVLGQLLLAGRDSAESQTQIDAIIRAEGVGMTFGRNLPPSGSPTFFPTSYREYFVCNILLTAQNTETGLNWQRLTASLSPQNNLSISFR